MRPPWQPGQSGNPAGPKHGARRKLSEAFLQDLHDAYQEHGRGILVQMATSRKESVRIQFAQLVHDLLPKHASLDINVAPSLPKDLAEMGDADWRLLFGIEVTKKE